VNSQVVSVILARSLEELVDSDNPQNVLKFRLVCDYSDHEDTVSFQRWAKLIFCDRHNESTPGEFIAFPC
jgi:hypothetical protein